MTTTEIFLIAMAIIFTVPYLVWRLGRTDYVAPLVVVQIIMGVVLGPGVLGRFFPEYHAFVFTAPVVQSLNGLAWWAVSLFVFIAGLELDLGMTWRHRRETSITAALSLGMPLILGCAVAFVLMTMGGWLGPAAQPWQFVAGVGMGCAVTALPIIILLMEKMDILRQPLGQRVLRYASLDDVAIWAVLAVILMDWARVGRQVAFLALFALATWGVRRLLARLPAADRWYVGIVWLILVALGADWAGLHYMVGAFLAGAVLEARWFGQAQVDQLRHHVLLVMMPVFFLSTGLRTQWDIGGAAVFLGAAMLLAASVTGKLLAARMAGRVLGWPPGEAATIGWLLQTKGLIEIIFANILLDKKIITHETFTALLLMAVFSTMLTVPIVYPRLQKARERLKRAG
ncbi:cation:proton antiporter [uncultured Pseudacidovorax sp.]|uniref:cation:proton antiporter n=1 Tax=uncultured Pseudacidovorax sp. TaxID=679313 RepID=UPI0025DDB21A|nr:cation:proton antiporter [uncultured Pseudacidovorax sp.]